MARSRSHHRSTLLALSLALLLASTLTAATPAKAASTGVVVSQVYGGGGNTGATLRHDFVELFNRGSTVVDVTGWSMQYASAAGTVWQVTTLSGSIAPGQRYLVEQGSGGGGAEDLPTPDASDTIAMSATSGKVAVVSTATRLSCSVSCVADPSVVDFVGYGAAANEFEGSGPAPSGSNTTAVVREDGGCTDTDDNAADLSVAPPAPRNSAAAHTPCSPVADLSLDVRQLRAMLRAGEPNRYVLTVTNAGPATATDVTLSDTLPAGVVFEFARGPASCEESSSTVTCSLGSLDVDETAAVTLFVSPTLAGDVTNTADASAPETDPSPARGAVTTTVEGPDCDIVGTGSDDALTGGQPDEVLCGLWGHDTLDGAGGADTVVGGGGNDVLLGGPGADVLEGFEGGDRLTGSAGHDTLLGGPQGDLIEARDGEPDDVDGGGSTDKCRTDEVDRVAACP